MDDLYINFNIRESTVPIGIICQLRMQGKESGFVLRR